MNECVQTGDWSGPAGEIPYHLPVSWSEAANMMSICELPGIYVVTDTAEIVAIDHVDVEVSENTPDKLVIAIRNPTAFDATVSVVSESTEDRARMLGQQAMLNCSTVFVPAEDAVLLAIGKGA